ncbi:hypothetical protein D3C87_1113180 [compost metagenome]
MRDGFDQPLIDAHQRRQFFIDLAEHGLAKADVYVSRTIFVHRVTSDIHGAGFSAEVHPSLAKQLVQTLQAFGPAHQVAVGIIPAQAFQCFKARLPGQAEISGHLRVDQAALQPRDGASLARRYLPASAHDPFAHQVLQQVAQSAGRDFRTGAQHTCKRGLLTLLVADVVQYPSGLRGEALAFANRHEQDLLLQIATGIELQRHSVGVWTLPVNLFDEPLHHPVLEECVALLDPRRVTLGQTYIVSLVGIEPAPGQRSEKT